MGSKVFSPDALAKENEWIWSANGSLKHIIKNVNTKFSKSIAWTIWSSFGFSSIVSFLFFFQFELYYLVGDGDCCAWSGH